MLEPWLEPSWSASLLTMPNPWSEWSQLTSSPTKDEASTTLLYREMCWMNVTQQRAPQLEASHTKWRKTSPVQNQRTCWKKQKTKANHRNTISQQQWLEKQQSESKTQVTNLSADFSSYAATATADDE
ncbi:hypothetical protein Fmac_004147 [Flemingia macrophylla]|uniref:Uncharacterized protein n=1 Tax=Flemingia macrophylla TaxID=520843 RepID=A0ABD1N440_9FABA